MPQQNSPLLKKFNIVISLGPEEEDFIKEMERERRPTTARTDLVKQGEKYQKIGLLHSGWAIRYKTLSDGRRHIINFLLPGDAYGVFSNLFEMADHSITMLTDGVLSVFEPETLVESYKRFPKVAAAFTWFAAREEALIAEHAAGLGQRTAFERLAHILLELYHRLDVVGLTLDGRFSMPVTQEILADTLGLSLVHANRTLRKLREANLIDTDGQTVTLKDYDRLAKLADFDESYLHLRPMSKRVERQFTTAA